MKLRERKNEVNGGNISKVHQCGLCGKKFAKYASLHYHCKLHNGEREYKCGTCSGEFITKKQLTVHQLVHQVIKRHKCDTCQKEFTLKYRLVGHKRSHSAAQKLLSLSSDAVTCTPGFQLPNRAKQKKVLFLLKPKSTKRRINIYTGVKPFRCETCNKTFVLRTELESHKNKCHTEFKDSQDIGMLENISVAQPAAINTAVELERGFECQVCSTHFLSKIHFQSHILIHLSRKK